MPSVIDERQAERLQYIDLCAYVLGAVNRNVLIAYSGEVEQPFRPT